jgi:hypothetical protein
VSILRQAGGKAGIKWRPSLEFKYFLSLSMQIQISRGCQMINRNESSGLKKKELRCQRCGGRMLVEKFYDVNNVFFGWHCVICGEILDPVILLHRLSQDADLTIPENENEILNMVKKYLQNGNKVLKSQKMESKTSN